MLSISTLTGLAFTGVLAVVVWKAYPKPIAGIPYHKKSARSILGDLPRLTKSLKESQDFIKYVVEEAETFQTPIFQLFLEPFSTPLVVLADYEEARDIMLHRTGEFDRSTRIRDIFRPVVGTNQFAQGLGDTWKFHRRLVQDTMSPVFLREVAAPNLYKSFQVLVNLWERKIELAAGRPFPVADDISAATLDGVLSFTFGSDLPNNATRPRLEALSNLDPKSLTPSLDQDGSVDFPTNTLHPSIASLHGVSNYLAKVSTYPLPKVAWWFFQMTSHFRRQVKTKNAFIRGEIAKSIQSHADKEEGGTVLRNAVDLVIDRERKLSERYGKQPDYYSEAILDELFGFVLAGHETTSSTMAWTMKILSSHPSAQLKLRQHLHEAYPDAVAENRSPHLDEILGSSIPYLDAFMHESLRRWPTVVMNDRSTVGEVTLLGHSIPNNTAVGFLQIGPSFTGRGYQIDEAKRSDSWRKDQATVKREAETDDMDEFKPERWLKQEKDSDEAIFDSQAWPMATFGMGPRGCFGRRLAMMEFRFLVILLVWNFEYLSLPDALSGWEGEISATYLPRKCYIRARKVTPGLSHTD